MERSDSSQAADIDFSRLIPIFPLPNVVLLPRVVLPLHVFEERYRAMTRETLKGDRVMCVALLKPGFEKSYHTLNSGIHPIVGVGRILREECLKDGRFNFLLQGLTRARIIDENKDKMYRRALLQPLPPTAQTEATDLIIRTEIRMLLRNSAFAELAEQSQWMEMISCPDLCLSDLLDILGSALCTCPESKQRLLSEPSVIARGRMIREKLQHLSIECLAARQARHARAWPPQFCDN